ncbi:MAG: hypothetical protein B7Z68_00590 [Acidobacteria bacterium 21-70-11]|nr:MAG: hypothetical protein B7Z68_00590 [Acidobacteria bacterium 21-70-11]OYW04954.1 MAG: hypothetical protein B7Z61_07900 [Acidobacteria bacterium 37-71-11]
MIDAAQKDAAIPDQPSSGDGHPRETAKQPARRGRMRLGLAGFLFELILPAALAGALLLVAASHLPLWDLRTTAGLMVFGVLLVAASVFLSIKVDGWTLARRRRAGTSQLFNRAGPWPRLVKFILAGVVVPVAALVAANRVELPGHRTPMALAIEASAPAPEVPGESKLAAAVLRASDPAAKIEGILALQAAATPAALDELLRIADADPAALTGGPVSLALAKALASFGAQAAPKLLQRLAEIGPAARKAAAGPGGSPFERYLSPGFEAAKREIGARHLDQAAQAAILARLQASEDAAESALRTAEPGGVASGEGSGLPALVMQALLAMNVKQDAAVLAFARATAADAAWSDGVRGEALLLVAKLGGKDDLPGLFAYLDSPSALLRARAMQAIAELEAKLAPAGGAG